MLFYLLKALCFWRCVFLLVAPLMCGRGSNTSAVVWLITLVPGSVTHLYSHPAIDFFFKSNKRSTIKNKMHNHISDHIFLAIFFLYCCKYFLLKTAVQCH